MQERVTYRCLHAASAQVVLPLQIRRGWGLLVMNAYCNSGTVAFGEMQCHAAGRLSESFRCVTHSWCRSKQARGEERRQANSLALAQRRSRPPRVRQTVFTNYPLRKRRKIQHILRRHSVFTAVWISLSRDNRPRVLAWPLALPLNTGVRGPGGERAYHLF